MGKKIKRWYAPEVFMDSGDGLAPVCLSEDTKKLENENRIFQDACVNLQKMFRNMEIEIARLKAERDELKKMDRAYTLFCAKLLDHEGAVITEEGLQIIMSEVSRELGWQPKESPNDQ